MTLKQIEPGIMFSFKNLANRPGHYVKMNTKQEYLNPPWRDNLWVLYLFTGRCYQVDGAEKVLVLLDADKLRRTG